MFCPNCGKELPGDSAFCEFCGAKLEASPKPEAQPPVQPMRQPVQQMPYQQPVQQPPYQQPMQQMPYQQPAMQGASYPQYAPYRQPKKKTSILTILLIIVALALGAYLFKSMVLDKKQGKKQSKDDTPTEQSGGLLLDLNSPGKPKK